MNEHQTQAFGANRCRSFVVLKILHVVAAPPGRQTLGKALYNFVISISSKVENSVYRAVIIYIWTRNSDAPCVMKNEGVIGETR